MTQEELQKLLTDFESEIGHIKEWEIDRNARFKSNARLGGLATGKIQGKKNVESGHWNRIVNSETRRKGAITQIENKIGMFNPENRDEYSTLGGYAYMNKYSLEERKKMGMCVGSPLKPILQCDLNGNVIKEWSSQKEASIILGLKHQHIQAVLSGKRKKHKGFIWKYKD